MESKNDVAIIIPAYEPDINLINLINDLSKNKYSNIIVINDGSESNKVFDVIKNKIILLEHDKNYGKGKALKTGFEYCINNIYNIKDIIGVITVDADGQHKITDIEKVYNKFEQKKDSLILGSRTFGKNRSTIKK